MHHQWYGDAVIPGVGERGGLSVDVGFSVRWHGWGRCLGSAVRPGRAAWGVRADPNTGWRGGRWTKPFDSPRPRKAEGGLHGMHTAQASNLVENLRAPNWVRLCRKPLSCFLDVFV